MVEELEFDAYPDCTVRDERSWRGGRLNEVAFDTTFDAISTAGP